jgi:CrcB protein
LGVLGRVPLRWRRRLAVATGGAVGSGLRVAVVAAVPVAGNGWPWGTFLANVTGALLLGYLQARLLAAAPRTTLSVPLLCTGLLGGYTTFSSFAMEVAQLVGAGRLGVGIGYGIGSVAVGYGVAHAGIRLADRRRP